MWILALTIVCSFTSFAQSTYGRNRALTPEQRAARFFESIRKSPPQQLAFLLKMPKGGDLHSHLSGSVYAERYIEWAGTKGLCVNQTTMTLSEPPCKSEAGQVPAASASANPVLYREMIYAWSMLFWKFSGQNGHDHFFDAFGKFGPATYGQTGKMLADAVSRAARGRVSYLELMLTPDGGMSSQIGQSVGWDGNFGTTLSKLKDAGISNAVTAGVTALQTAEAEKDKILKMWNFECRSGLLCYYSIYFASLARVRTRRSVCSDGYWI